MAQYAGCGSRHMKTHGFQAYATMIKTLEARKNKEKITHSNMLENVFEGQTLDMLAYQTLG